MGCDTKTSQCELLSKNSATTLQALEQTLNKIFLLNNGAKVIADFRFADDKLYNIATPVLKPLPTKKDGKYCKILSSIFKLTSPTCAEFENGKSPLLPIYVKDSTLYLGCNTTTDKNEYYNYSTYGLIEARLKDTNVFPLKSIND